VETINFELIFADIETVEKRIDRTKKQLKSGDKKFQAEIDLYERVKKTLESGLSARAAAYAAEETVSLRELSLLTMKPVILAANVAEDELGGGYLENENYKRLAAYAETDGCEIIPVSARIEEELSQLDDAEKTAFLGDLGVTESGLDRLVKASYSLLGLISYLTSGPTETRAWTITKGTKAPGAAGKIHTDFERGFIRAEVVAYDDLTRCGSMAAAKEKGLVRSEGKEYVVCDGDVVLFRFNV
jgi:GTP-binding protein YchF